MMRNFFVFITAIIVFFICIIPFDTVFSSGTTLIKDESSSWSEKDIVAIVNGEKLSKGDLYDLLVSTYGEEALDVLIRRTLINQEARKHGIKLKKAEVEEKLNTLINREIMALMKAYKIEDREGLEKELTKMGGSVEDLRAKLAKKLEEQAVIELRAEKIMSKSISVSDKELKEAYDQMYGEKIEAKQIVLQTRRDAEEVLEKLKLGADFAALAKATSIDRASASRDGNMLPFSPKDTLGKEVAHLKVGELSDIIKTNYGYHVIKITGRKRASGKSFKNVKDELQEAIKRQKYQKRLKSWLINLIENATITKKLQSN